MDILACAIDAFILGLMCLVGRDGQPDKPSDQAMNGIMIALIGLLIVVPAWLSVHAHTGTLVGLAITAAGLLWAAVAWIKLKLTSRY